MVCLSLSFGPFELDTINFQSPSMHNDNLGWPRGCESQPHCAKRVRREYTAVLPRHRYQVGQCPTSPLVFARSHAVRIVGAKSRLLARCSHFAGSTWLVHQSGKWWEGNFRRGGFTHGMTRVFPNQGGRHGDDGLKIGREGMAPVLDFIDME